MANQTQSINQVEELASPLCEAHGVELVEIRMLREKGGGVLRVTIDRSTMDGPAASDGDKPIYRSGITLEDCTNVSRDLSEALDMHEGLIGGHYRLEVSSPGLERPLVKESDFKRFVGFEIKIKTLAPIDGRRNFQGVLVGIEAGTVQIDLEGTNHALPFSDIHRAHLIHRF